MKIKNIKKINKEITYDLSIEDNHNYFVGNSEILVHNSGKDPSKVDRSGAYFARYVSKNLVAANIADEIIVEVSYVIGGIEPISVNVSTKTKNKKVNLSDSEISKIVQELFSFKPKDIINKLKLKNPIYLKTAGQGHFGHNSYIKDGIQFFTWEELDSVDLIKERFKKYYIEDPSLNSVFV